MVTCEELLHSLVIDKANNRFELTMLCPRLGVSETLGSVLENIAECEVFMSDFVDAVQTRLGEE